MYGFDSRVRYSEIDEFGFLKVSSLVNYFQDCSTFHSEDSFVGEEFCMKRRCAWILCSWQIIVNRMPKLGEHIRITTWPNELRGFYGFRNYSMTDENDKVCAFANSVWVYLNMDTKKPDKIPLEILQALEIKPPIEWKWCGRKLRLPEEGELKEPFEIVREHLDTNLHVNNGKYIWMAMQYLPEDFDLYQVRVEYRNEARRGDIFYPKLAISNDKTVVMFYNRTNVLYAAVEFENKNLSCS